MKKTKEVFNYLNTIKEERSLIYKDREPKNDDEDDMFKRDKSKGPTVKKIIERKNKTNIY